MPIVTITALEPTNLDTDRLLRRVVDAVSSGLGCSPGDVWVSFVAAAGQSVGGRKAAAQSPSEHKATATGQGVGERPAGVAEQDAGERVAAEIGQCPIVIIRGRPRDAGSIAAALAATAVAVGAELGVPLEDVWLQWIDVTTGFAGGGFLT